jgi:beta-galactosidase
MEALLDYYRPLAQAGYSVDFAHPEQDLSKYKLVIAPSLYLISDLGLEQIRVAVENGTNLVFGKFSGAVDAEEGVRIGGHLVGLRDVFGCYTEEWHPLLPEQTVEIDYASRSGVVSGWTEHIRLLPGSQVEATFQSGDLAGLPAIVSNRLSKSKAWYLGCTPDRELLSSLLKTICSESGVTPILANLPQGVEVTQRENANGDFLFLLNHSNIDQVIVVGQKATDVLSDEVLNDHVTLGAGAVRVLRLEK